MEILYINILDFNQYRNVDLNLGGKYRFKYNTEREILEISEDPFYVEDFFESKISNNCSNQAIVTKVNCILGENGSGKSTFFNFIKLNFPRGVTQMGHSCIIAVIENGINKIYYFSDSITIKNVNKLDFGFIAEPLKFQVSYLDKKRKKYETKIGPELPKGFRDTDFIYLSNIFDSNNEFQVNGLKNLSTNWLVKADKKGLLENKISKKMTNEVETHKIEDVIRQIDFVFSYKNYEKFIHFNLPEIIYFTPKDGRDFVNDNLARDLINQSSKPENPNYWLIAEVIARCKEENEKSKDIIQNTIRTFYTNTFINFLDELDSRLSFNGDPQISASFPEFFKNYKHKVYSDLVQHIDAITDDFLNFIKKASPINQNIVEERILNTKSFLNKLKHLILNNSHKALSSHNKFGNSFAIDISENFIAVKEFIDIYKRSYAIIPFLDFKWRSISSGQLALFNIYSRLYTLIDENTASNQKLKENIVIMIDEADTYLHPRWSQTIVSSIIDFVSDIYTAKNVKVNRKIHIIFTSNSPFIASDIPNNYVVFLRKGDAKSNYRVTSLNSLDDKKMTFCSNIHTLLLDAFFLPNGSIGEFSKQKIDELIDNLNSPLPFLDDKKKASMYKTISIIGEPVIKRKLLQMFNDRFNVDIDGRIKYLEEEIIKLKKSKEK